MSEDHILPIGARRATFADAQEVFKTIRDVVSEFHYQTGLAGSTLTDGEGIDVDLICAYTADSEYSGAAVANEIIRHYSDASLLEYLQGDDESWAAFALLLPSKVYIDLYIVGLAQEG